MRTSKYELAVLVQECTRSLDLSRGRWIHQRIVEDGYGGDTYLGNLLINMYKCCGSLDGATAVFERIQSRANLCTTNTMLSAYAQLGHLLEAKQLFDRMPSRDSISWNSMLDAYSRNGDLEMAKTTFDAMDSPRGVVSWGAMLAAYARAGNCNAAATVMAKMPQLNTIAANAFITALARKGDSIRAARIFDSMPWRNAATWNSIAVAFAQAGYLHRARGVFERLPQWDSVSWTTMVWLYGGEGDDEKLDEARRLFEEMPAAARNVVAWNAMVMSYARHGRGDEARKLFARMLVEGVAPTKVSFVAALDGCCAAAAAIGRELHEAIEASGCGSDEVLETAVLTMYGRCGKLDDARQVFDWMASKGSVEPWNAMIGAYSTIGAAMEAIDLFRKMDLEGVMPNKISFMNLLLACCHGGLVAGALPCLLSMAVDYGVEADAEHYACLVDAVGRAGLMFEAEELAMASMNDGGPVPLTMLLSACRIHTEEQVFKQDLNR